MTASAVPWLPVATVAVAAAFAVMGCSSRPPDQPPLGRVRGTVTMNGRPLAGVDVVFSPETGRPSVATTDPAGRYDLTYVNITKGAKVGRHKVSITPTDVSGGEASGSAAKNGGPATPPVSVPKKYNSRSTLTAEVKPGGNTINFPLDSK
jgi:hypothetical protein